MIRRVLTMLLVVVAASAVWAVAAWADDTGFAEVSPSSGPPGTEITYRVAGGGSGGEAECRASSAFRTELLAADGSRLETGGDTIAVPASATPGPAFVRLVCYIPDATGRRVIRGVCTAFEITAAGSALGPPNTAAAASTVDVPCPVAPRVVVSQSVIGVQEILGSTFNTILAQSS